MTRHDVDEKLATLAAVPCGTGFVPTEQVATVIKKGGLEVVEEMVQKHE